MPLPEDDPATFQIVKNWLYTQKLVTEDEKGEDASCSSKMLMALYVFGDARGIPHLQNAVINAIRNQKAIPVPQVPYIFENTPESSPLRRLLVDMIAWDMWDRLDFNEGCAFKPGYRNCHTPESLMRLVVAVSKIPRPMVIANAPYRKDICSYHEHPDGEARCRK